MGLGEWSIQDTVKFIRLVEQNIGKKFLNDDIDDQIQGFIDSHKKNGVRTQRRRSSRGLSESMVKR